MNNMEIKHEHINIVENQYLTECQKDVRDEQELTRRFIESCLSSFEMKFGQMIPSKTNQVTQL